MSVVIIGSLLIVVCMFLFLEFKPVPGAFVGWAANLAASLLVVVFGFLFVTVSSRIVGLVGSSASPVSGMTIATLMATAAVFLVQGGRARFLARSPSPSAAWFASPLRTPATRRRT